MSTILRLHLIVNCAAYTAVDQAEESFDLCNKLNNIAPGYLARAAQSRGAAIIQISTDYVFDGTAHRSLHRREGDLS